MVILGVDPALVITGYGAIEARGNRLSLLEAGIVKVSAKDELPERLNKVYQALSKIIADIKPGVVVLEKLYAHYRHPVTACLLGHARGVICLASAEAGVPLVEYSATRVKKAVVGRGLAGKLQVQGMVARILNLKTLPKYMDVTDALALALAHSYILRPKL